MKILDDDEKLWRISWNKSQSILAKTEPNKTYLQQIASNYLPDTEFKYFMKLYEDYNEVPILFLINDTTLSSDN